MWYDYILKCSDNSYYAGCTNNLNNRFEIHKKCIFEPPEDEISSRINPFKNIKFNTLVDYSTYFHNYALFLFLTA